MITYKHLLSSHDNYTMVQGSRILDSQLANCCCKQTKNVFTFSSKHSPQQQLSFNSRKSSKPTVVYYTYIAQDDLIPWVTTCPINQGSHLLQSEIIATHHCVNSYEL